MCTRKRIIESTPTTILQERTEYQFLLNSFVFSFVGLKCSFDFWLRKEYYSCIVAEITVKHAGHGSLGCVYAENKAILKVGLMVWIRLKGTMSLDSLKLRQS